jgi:hypothetical protein
MGRFRDCLALHANAVHDCESPKLAQQWHLSHGRSRAVQQGLTHDNVLLNALQLRARAWMYWKSEISPPAATTVRSLTFTTRSMDL